MRIVVCWNSGCTGVGTLAAQEWTSLYRGTPNLPAGLLRPDMDSRKPIFQLPEYDELTHRPLLPKAALVHGRYYIGRCRNASVARWNASQHCFYHWREKFGRIYIEKIKHPDDEETFDVFRVLEELPEPKFVIKFHREARFRGEPETLTEFNERVWCSCDTGVRPCVVHFRNR